MKITLFFIIKIIGNLKKKTVSQRFLVEPEPLAFLLIARINHCPERECPPQDCSETSGARTLHSLPQNELMFLNNLCCFFFIPGEKKDQKHLR